MSSYILSFLLLMSAIALGSPRAVFEITNEVLQKSPARFGVNLTSKLVNHWENFRPDNRWLARSNMEPIDLAHIGTATGGSATSIEDKGGSSAGASYWGLFQDGFWDGADVFVYRETAGKMSLLRQAKVKAFKGKDSGERFELSQGGPSVQKGDFYLLSLSRGEVGPYRVEPKSYWVISKGHGDKVTQELDQKTFAPDDKSTASLKITLKEDAPGGAGILQYFQGDQPFWLHFREGKTYVFRAWMKQEGITGGEVTVRAKKINGLVQLFRVGGKWKLYEFEFQGARPVSKMAKLEIFFKTKGTLWLDSLEIYEKGLGSFASYPEVLKALKDFRPETIRFWSGHRGQRLNNWLRHPLAAHAQFRVNNSGNFDDPATPSLPQALELCQATGAQPWLIITPLMPPEDIAHLMEYLGGGAATPYGKIRKEHGQEKPWLEVFDTVYFEVGNEMWNPLFKPFAFPFNGTQSGVASEYFFDQVKQSPYFKDEKIEFIVGGWDYKTGKGGFGFQSAKVAKSAEAIALTSYIGGWDGYTIVGKDNDELFFQKLMYSARLIEPNKREHGSTFKDLGRKMDFLIYEGGPGYSMPSSQQTHSEEDEVVGKSIVAGIATLDAFMSNLSMGFKSQNFYAFESGPNWTTHSAMPDFRPHPSFLALQMRNQLLTGEMVKVSSVDVPKIDLKPTKHIREGKEKELAGRKAVPLVLCYAFRDGGRYSLLLISRQLKEKTEVRLKLPYAPKGQVTLYKLEASGPMASNRERTEVEVTTEKRNDFSKEYSLVLPPHSAYVLVSEAI